MSKVIAKFYVARIERNMGSTYNAETKQYDKAEQHTVVLYPVFSEDPNHENKKFWSATPSGEIKLGTVNPEAWKAFELDKQYYVTFEQAE